MGPTLAGGLIAVALAVSATDLAQSLQRKYDTIRDFSADFIHTYEGGVLHKQIAERGHELDELDERYQGWNARVEADGRLVPDIARI